MHFVAKTETLRVWQLGDCSNTFKGSLKHFSVFVTRKDWYRQRPVETPVSCMITCGILVSVSLVDYWGVNRWGEKLSEVLLDNLSPRQARTAPWTVLELDSCQEGTFLSQFPDCLLGSFVFLTGVVCAAGTARRGHSSFLWHIPALPPSCSWTAPLAQTPPWRG